MGWQVFEGGSGIGSRSFMHVTCLLVGWGMAPQGGRLR